MDHYIPVSWILVNFIKSRTNTVVDLSVNPSKQTNNKNL